MLCNSCANQGSIYHWARDHRVHHKFSETTADPHDATRGFFFAHMGWLFVKKHKDVVKAGREMDFSDLKEDPTPPETYDTFKGQSEKGGDAVTTGA